VHGEFEPQSAQLGGEYRVVFHQEVVETLFQCFEFAGRRLYEMRQELVTLDLVVQVAEYFFHHAYSTDFLQDVRGCQQPSIAVQAVEKTLPS